MAATASSTPFPNLGMVWEGRSKDVLLYWHQETTESWQNMKELFQGLDLLRILPQLSLWHWSLIIKQT